MTVILVYPKLLISASLFPSHSDRKPYSILWRAITHCLFASDKLLVVSAIAFLKERGV